MSTEAPQQPEAAPGTPAGVPPKPGIVLRLEAQREHHRHRGRLVRMGTVAAGFATVIGGIVLLPLPGPGWLIIFIGLGLLSLEFEWAGRALDRALIEADKARIRAENASTTQKVVVGVLVALVLAGLLAWAIWGDIPIVPV